MNYLRFHAVNAVLFVGVLWTLLPWVIWTPSVSAPPMDQEMTIIDLRETPQPD